mmetsp:Transcript_6977/g.14580  ORF Transcript_6977/g.14580 Transcript_6977/m.14580 type:complete len:254 (-) Transcript_6977:142-903(-)
MTSEKAEETKTPEAESQSQETPPPPPPPPTEGEDSDPPPPPPTPQKSMDLNDEWTLWYDHPKLAPAGADWSENLKQLATFRTVPDFWKVFNNVLPPTMIPVSGNYSIFRKGIEPAWEHPANLDGGKFVLTLPKHRGNNNNNSQNNNKNGKQQQQQQLQDVPKLDEYWLYTILAVLGETMDATGDQVCGAVVSVRKSQDRIALWLKTGDQKVCVRIGERWKKALDMEKTSLRYQTHKDAANAGRSFRIDVHFEV